MGWAEVVGEVVGNVVGDVIGDVVGNVVGSIFGSVVDIDVRDDDKDIGIDSVVISTVNIPDFITFADNGSDIQTCLGVAVGSSILKNQHLYGHAYERVSNDDFHPGGPCHDCDEVTPTECGDIDGDNNITILDIYPLGIAP